MPEHKITDKELARLKNIYERLEEEPILNKKILRDLKYWIEDAEGY
jgi:hypothetical protein